MTTIIPEGDNIRKAVKWIDGERQTSPEKSIIKLIDDAGMQFNLSPKDSEFLYRFFTKKD